ncbi:hypothetical protein [Arcobacter sp. LA11]|uniref:hypothetical protein n=1 Tax=Arcobacter sp. LA11 TaxID=1898176 RepID=UPI0009335676|nr:hypothetical protein [Arcobacter sp. LA11]
MTNLQRICFITGFTILFSGCVKENTSETIIPPKKPIVKKETKKKIVKQVKKKQITYKYCSKHTKVMAHASKYITEEFEKGYFIQKDVVGAKAQLFLIENKSPTIFAKNINAALESYNSQYQLAKKNKCNLKSFKISPISKVKNSIKILEKSDEKVNKK